MHTAQTSSGQLRIDSLSKRYGEIVALDDMSFTVAPGEIFGFVGSNGAGKTTTMRIILGVLQADAGAVTWGGAPIDLQLRRRVGYMPEERGLYPKMPVGQQLIYVARLHGLTKADAMRAAREWTERLGVAARWDDDVQKLSLGNQQRVQLAAALVHDPDILVLDEPFSGLDPVAVDVMSAVLAERAATGVPVIFSSHQLDLVQRVCDRVGIVKSGRMVACDRVDVLRSSGAARLVVTAPQAPPDWAQAVAGVSVESQVRGTSTLRLAPGTDDQTVLHAALATGPVTEFAWQRPDLTDLFRDVVSGDAVEEAA